MHLKHLKAVSKIKDKVKSKQDESEHAVRYLRLLYYGFALPL